MNEIERLASEIQANIPKALVRPDCPTDERRQNCWLDVELAGLAVAVEWRPGTGFGVSKVEASVDDPIAGLFSGPDQIVDTWNDAYAAVVKLLEIDQEESTRAPVVARGRG